MPLAWLKGKFERTVSGRRHIVGLSACHFVVANSGATDHELHLGDEAAQAEHEKEMAAMGGMTHDEPEGIAVKPSETKELTYTFAQAGKPSPAAISWVTTAAA